MISVAPAQPIHLCSSPTDMRKSFDSLCALICGSFKKNPLRDGLFVFVNKRRDKMKILVWDRHGFWLFFKRLEAGVFQMPPQNTGCAPELLTITYEQLVMIIEGIDLSTIRRKKRYVTTQL